MGYLQQLLDSQNCEGTKLCVGWGGWRGWFSLFFLREMGVLTSRQLFSCIVLLGDRRGRGLGWRWMPWNGKRRVQTSMWNVNCALTEQHVKVLQTRKYFFFYSIMSAHLLIKRGKKQQIFILSLVSIQFYKPTAAFPQWNRKLGDLWLKESTCRHEGARG